MDEFDIIKTYFQPLSNNCSQSENLQDDIATISIDDGHQLVVSKDMIIEDIHFKKSNGAANIANKLLKSNLSDLASSGATPLYYMLGFSKNKEIDENFIKDFCSGLKQTADEYKISLIGGDTVNSDDKLLFSITIFGKTKKGTSLSRSNAQEKDLIFVSGNIGDAFLGLSILQDNSSITLNSECKKYLISRHLQPTPRIKLGQKLLQNNLSNCAIDISDGILADLKHICQSSKLKATIYQDKIPTSLEARKFLQDNDKFNILNLLSGGDDYELIFTIKEKNLQTLEKLSKDINLKLSHIGYLENGPPEITLLNKNNQKVEISKYGYNHS